VSGLQAAEGPSVQIWLRGTTELARVHGTTKPVFRQLLVLALKVEKSGARWAARRRLEDQHHTHGQMTAEATAACMAIAEKCLFLVAMSRRCLHKRPARPEQVVKLLFEEAGRDDVGRCQV